MHVLIYETQHFHAVYPVISFFHLPGNKVTLIITPSANNSLQHMLGNRFPQLEIIELDFSIGALNYYRQIVRIITNTKPDIIFLSTVNRHHWLIARALTKTTGFEKIILTVHDVNSFFNPKKALNLRTLVRNLGKAALRKSVKEFNVLSPAMKETLKPFLRHGEVVHNIPGNYFEGIAPARHYSDRLILVVPGTLDYARRNYDEVFELALMAEKTQCRLEIILAGGHQGMNDGKEIAGRANRYLGKFTSVITHNLAELPQPLFDEFFKIAHFVWIPSVISTRSDRGTVEVYGVTKMSGTLFDSIRHALPCILPQALLIPSDIETSVYRYSSLSDILRLMITMSEGIYQQWQAKALDTAHHYTIEKLREKNPALLG